MSKRFGGARLGWVGWLIVPMTALLVAGVGATAVASTATGSGPAQTNRLVRAATGSVSAPATSCASLAGQDLTHIAGLPPAEVGTATDKAMNGTTYCAVTGYVAPQETFSLFLPESTWHGDYLQVGCGGFCGVDFTGIAPFASSGCVQLNNNELVIAGDNEGHVGVRAPGGVTNPELDNPTDDPTWAANDIAARVTYGYTSEHILRQVANKLIQAYYGRPPAERYFDGCSDGGREALDLAERYPHDFNGILAGAPALNFGALFAESFAWQARVNSDASGHEILTPAKLPALHAAVLKACANADGYIADPRRCTFQPASMQCATGTDSDSCLTPTQVAAVRNLYRGPHDAHGHSFYDGGMPYGSELAWGSSVLPTITSPSGLMKDTVAYDYGQGYLADLAFLRNPSQRFTFKNWHFNVASYEKMERGLAGIYDTSDPDLRPFKRAGGKIIFYHGWSDQAIPPFSTLDYYASVERAVGGFSASQAFSRLYMVPGAYHCFFGGDPTASGADFLSPLINWVESGRAPHAVAVPIATQTTGNKITSLTVRPMNALSPAPRNNGLNSNYHLYKPNEIYSQHHEKVCTFRNGAYHCRKALQ